MRTPVNLVLLGIIAALILGCGQSTDRSAEIEDHLTLAGELKEYNLYNEAVAEYVKALGIPGMERTKRANVNYLIAKVYFESLKDYEKAAAYYLRARELDPQGSFVAEASRNLVTSLERLGNVLDARQELSTVTDVDAQPREKDDVPVATIGMDSIWLSEIEAAIQTLPPEIQEQFLTRSGKTEFVRNYVGTELMFRAAQRLNYGSDPEIKRQQQQAYKQLLVEKYVIENVIPDVQIDTSDVRNFYAANKSERYGDAPYDSVRAQVFLDYQNQKAQSAFSEYIQKLARQENVEFLDRNVR